MVYTRLDLAEHPTPPAAFQLHRLEIPESPNSGVRTSRSESGETIRESFEQRKRGEVERE